MLKKERHLFCQCPLFLYALSFFSGCALILAPYQAALCALSFLLFHIAYLFLTQNARLAMHALLAIALGAVYTFLTVPYRRLPEKGLKGRIEFQSAHIVPCKPPFKGFLYQGTLTKFQGQNLNLHHLPCSIFVNEEETTRPLAATFYLFGTLKEKRRGNYFFQPDPLAWIEKKSPFSLPEIRYSLQKKWKATLCKLYPNSHVREFLAGMTFGECNDSYIQYELKRLGGIHLLAISGFHFSLLASLLSFICKKWMPYKCLAGLIFIFASGYFLLLGFSPSIFRAYFATIISSLSLLCSRSYNPLNAFGVGLLGVLLYNPLSIFSTAFQLSYIATASILLFYPLIDRRLAALRLPAFVRINLSLSMAVNCGLLFWLLYLFHSFSLLSLLCNIFLPGCAAFFLALFCLAWIGMPFIPLLGKALHTGNHFLMQKLLAALNHIPRRWEVAFETNLVSVVGAVFALCCIFSLAIHLQSLAAQQDFPLTRKAPLV